MIKLHLERGDRIWFVTGRPKPTNGKETVTELLGRDFSIPHEKLNKVIFAGEDKGQKYNISVTEISSYIMEIQMATLRMLVKLAQNLFA